ncbi:hypothetical protein [Microvirga splendida]|uniref:Uncharacterized protein n=1 Tax=Microvirga splendida TaxID=2795727 RepID=A0ABS0Y4H1_9HYPH|nr:hypothetical protein [Microvirga splendida]MBJ6127199.1 hypothetical protein [Microvirga splendida]
MTNKTDTMADCSAGLRNRFFPRKRMLAGDFGLEQRYGIGRRRLVNAAVLGHGVVYGFSVPHPKQDGFATSDGPTDPQREKPEEVNPQQPAQLEKQEGVPHPAKEDGVPQSEKKDSAARKAEPRDLTVRAGFALDIVGREIVLEQDTVLHAGNTFALVRSNGVHRIRKLEDLGQGHHVLAVHYAERLAGTAVADWCECGEPDRTHLCETVVFTLRRQGEECHGEGCACGEDDCPSSVDCGTDTCSMLRPHARLVDWVHERGVPQTRELCLFKESGLSIALEGVDIACVDIVEDVDKCSPIQVDWVDDSSPKRLVKSNDSLYDLICGCDLTRIKDISWGRLGPETDLDQFINLLNPPVNGDPTHRTNFRVDFSRPVKLESLKRPDVVAIAVLKADRSNWLEMLRLPISELIADNVDGDGARSFHVGIESTFTVEEVKAKYSALKGGGFVVEIEIRCDLIEDCAGVPVDGNARGIALVPSGNGTPGGTHFSCFRVKAQ